MTEQMKLCKDCKHYIKTSAQGDNRCRIQFYDCRETSLVTGGEIGYIVFSPCSDMRYEGACGKEARLFEPLPQGFFTRMWNRLFGKDTQQ